MKLEQRYGLREDIVASVDAVVGAGRFAGEDIECLRVTRDWVSA